MVLLKFLVAHNKKLYIQVQFFCNLWWREKFGSEERVVLETEEEAVMAENIVEEQLG